MLALLGLVAVATATPGADCNGLSDDSSVGQGLTLAVAIVASLGALAASVGRVVSLRRGAGIASWQILAALVGTVLLVVLSYWIDLGGSGTDYIWSLDFAGMLATAAALLALIVAWMLKRSPDQAGLLLPLYLLGAALFVYPGFALIAIGAKSGAFC